MLPLGGGVLQTPRGSDLIIPYYILQQVVKEPSPVGVGGPCLTRTGVFRIKTERLHRWTTGPLSKRPLRPEQLADLVNLGLRMRILPKGIHSLQ